MEKQRTQAERATGLSAVVAHTRAAKVDGDAAAAKPAIAKGG
jgi:hypothetical protein